MPDTMFSDAVMTNANNYVWVKKVFAQTDTG